MNNEQKSSRWSNDVGDKRKIEKQKLRNNILGIFILIIMLFLGFDIGGCSSMLSSLLLQQ